MPFVSVRPVGVPNLKFDESAISKTQLGNAPVNSPGWQNIVPERAVGGKTMQDGGFATRIIAHEHNLPSDGDLLFHHGDRPPIFQGAS